MRPTCTDQTARSSQQAQLRDDWQHTNVPFSQREPRVLTTRQHTPSPQSLSRARQPLFRGRPSPAWGRSPRRSRPQLCRPGGMSVTESREASLERGLSAAASERRTPRRAWQSSCEQRGACCRDQRGEFTSAATGLFAFRRLGPFWSAADTHRQALRIGSCTRSFCAIHRKKHGRPCRAAVLPRRPRWRGA